MGKSMAGFVPKSKRLRRERAFRQQVRAQVMQGVVSRARAELTPLGFLVEVAKPRVQPATPAGDLSGLDALGLPVQRGDVRRWDELGFPLETSAPRREGPADDGSRSLPTRCECRGRS